MSTGTSQRFTRYTRRNDRKKKKKRKKNEESKDICLASFNRITGNLFRCEKRKKRRKFKADRRRKSRAAVFLIARRYLKKISTNQSTDWPIINRYWITSWWSRIGIKRPDKLRQSISACVAMQIYDRATLSRSMIAKQRSVSWESKTLLLSTD